MLLSIVLRWAESASRTSPRATRAEPVATTVLQNLNLHSRRSDYRVRRPPGCGKTTSLRMINRMVEPNSGTITIDGVNVHEKNSLRAAPRHYLRDATGRAHANRNQ